MLIGITFIAGVVLGLILIAYDDQIPCALWRKFRCKIGWHKNRTFKIRKYYCKFCKKPRKFPELKVIDGGNKIRDDRYKF